MAKIEYPEGPLEREYLRDALRRQGKDSIDEVAEAIQRRWHHSPLRAYRLARELSLEDVCKQINLLSETFVEEPGYFRCPTLSRYEYWPATPKSRRPTVGHLAALARVYGTSPRNLIADTDWTKIPPADRYIIQALDTQTPATATPPANDPGMMETTRPQASTTPRTPPNWWTTPETIGSGNPIEKLVTMTNDESTRYADRGSNVGPAGLEQLRDNVAQVSGRFANGPRGLELFGSVRMLRDRIFSFLDGGQPIRERRDLYFLAAAACGLLAVISDDLGYKDAGMSQIRVAHVFASEVGDPALTGWLYTRQATISYWNGQPGKARDYARRGAALHPAGTVAASLPAMEARASGALGDAEATRAAIHRATENRELIQPGTLDEFGGMMAYSQAKQHFYAADAFLGIGDDAAAVAEATAAVEAYEAGPTDEYNYTDLAITHFDAAIAHVRAGDLDAASQSAQAAFDIGAGSRSANVDTTARRLHHHLRAAEIRTSPIAVGTRDQLEDFLSVTPARLELS